MNTLTAIRVEHYRRLTIINQTVIAGCEQLWQGIRLIFEAELYMQNSTIRDAYNGVTAESNSEISLVGNTFDNNNIGFYVPPNLISPDNHIKPLPGNDDDDFFRDNVFTSTYTMLPPLNNSGLPTAGIVLHQTQGFDIGDPNNGTIKNYFDNLTNGVMLYNLMSGAFGGLEMQTIKNQGIFITGNTMGVNLHDNRIRDVTVGIYAYDVEGLDVLDNEIKLCKNVAISVEDSGGGNVLINGNNIVTEAAPSNLIYEPDAISISTCTVEEGYAITVSSNTIKVAEGGVIISATNGQVSVIENVIKYTYDGDTDGIGIAVLDSEGEITVKGNFIKKTGIGNVSSGISHFGSQGSQVAENTIIGDFTYGLYCYQSTNIDFCCNTINGPYYGVSFWDLCSDTQLKNTTFGNHNTALFYYDALTGPQVNTGNDWTGAITSLDAYFATGANFYPYTSSLFFTDPALVPAGNTKIIPVDWFTFQGTDPTCSSQVNCGIDPYELLAGGDPGSMLTSEDLLALEPPTSDELQAQVRQWEHQRYLFAKLSKHPELIAVNPAVNQFYNSVQHGLLGAFYELETGINALASPPANLKTAYDLSSDHLQSLGEELSDLRNARREADMLSLEKQKMLQTQMETVQGERAALKTQIQSWRIGEIKALQLAVESLRVETDFQQNLKDYYQIYLQSVALKQELTDDQQAELLAIAEQCPSTGGHAVIKARALCQKFAGSWHWDWDDCHPGEMTPQPDLNRDSKISKRQEQVRLFPNPTNGQFTLNLGHPLSSAGQLVVQAMDGKILHTQTLAVDMIKTEMDVSHLPKGIYTIAVLEQEQRIATLRLTLIE
ncbi:MAG: NosD domain-containing protein [Bacteroidota bacterium]